MSNCQSVVCHLSVKLKEFRFQRCFVLVCCNLKLMKKIVYQQSIKELLTLYNEEYFYANERSVLFSQEFSLK